MNENRGLWRGKRVDDGKWIKGSYVCLYNSHHYIYSGKAACNTNEMIYNSEFFPIDPSTLGECTGLTDKNGKLIFEGDIISFMESTEKYYVTKWDKENACFYCDRDVYVKSWCESQYGIIVGNIHDNPELIKGDENNG